MMFPARCIIVDGADKKQLRRVHGRPGCLVAGQPLHTSRLKRKERMRAPDFPSEYITAVLQLQYGPY
jgi:hypothetical protein